jgi:hypothetical protein
VVTDSVLIRSAVSSLVTVIHILRHSLLLSPKPEVTHAWTSLVDPSGRAVCARWTAEIAVSNPAGGMEVCLL